MTFTEKMILSGALLFSVMRLITKTIKSGGDDVPFWVSFTGVLSLVDVMAFSAVWIWSQ